MGISSMFDEKVANFTGMTRPIDENTIFVNEFTQTTAINTNCIKVEPTSSINENNGFILDSQFVYIVYGNKNHIPLLIGKLSDPKSAKPLKGLQTSCELPVVENGYIIEDLFQGNITSTETVEVETQVYVKCHANYDMQSEERTHIRTCKSDGWDGDFPKCKRNT